MQSFNNSNDTYNESMTRASELVSLIKGDDNVSRSMALESECEHLKTLANPSSQESMLSLAAHLPVLEALFHRLSLDALSTRYPANKVALMRAALQAQNAYARTSALLSVLKQQQLASTKAPSLELEVWK
jgi:acyl-CoA hydrolase